MLHEIVDSTRRIVIFCRDLEKRFVDPTAREIATLLFTGRRPGGGVLALSGIDLEVVEGQFVGLLGRNGAGKSTLLRVIGGIYAGTAGRVVVMVPPSGIYELGVGGNDLLTGREFARRWLLLNRVPATEVPAILDEVRSFTELDGAFDSLIFSYSTGMRARLYFAAAMAIPAKIYLVDEVLSVGDAYFGAKCRRLIRERLSQGASGILATHDWSAVLRLCTQCATMEDGEIVDFGSAVDIVRRYIAEPPPPRDGGYLTEGNPERYSAQSGEDAKWTFEVRVTSHEMVFLFFSVEHLEPGFGWEHYIHGEFIEVGNTPGLYRVGVQVPAFPLAPGGYLLNVQLSVKVPDTDSRMRTLDSRSWSNGRPFDLSVTGPDTGDRIPLSCQWAVGD